MLGRIQNDLFDLGADLATVETDKPLPYEPLRITQGQVDRLEQEIDRLNAELSRRCVPSSCPAERPPPPRFISPARSAVVPSGMWSSSWRSRTRRSRRRP